MRPLKNLIPFLLLVLGGVSNLAGQTAFRFEHINSRDGLSQTQAYSILQDRYGYLWVGTQDGLNRYDGKTFKVFKNDPFDSTTLTHNWVWNIAEDRHGDLWIGTFQGLCRYVRSEDRFVQYYHRRNDSTSISGNRTNFVVQDKKGRLWISTWGSGLNLYDEKGDRFIRFQHDANNAQSISDNHIRTLFCDSHGNIWIGTWNGGLNRVVEDANGIRFQRFFSTEENTYRGGNQITSMAEDKSGNLWIASYTDGVTVFEKASNGFRRVPNFLPNDVNKVHCDGDGNVWIGTNSGVKIFDPTADAFHSLQHHPTDPTSISSNVVYEIAHDRQGIVWVAGSGLDKYDPAKNIFQSYSHDPNNANSLSENTVWSMCEDDEQNVWIGVESGPVSIFNPRTKTFRHLAVHDDRGNLALHVQRIIFHDGVFWMASFHSGLVRYDKKTGKARFFLGSHPSVLGKVAFIKDVLRDAQDGTLWIGTYDQGVIHFDPETDRVEHYVSKAGDESTIGGNFINLLYQDLRGNIWMGFLGGGISVLDRQTKKLSHYRYDRKNTRGLSDQMVSGIWQQNDSIFWICTHTGLNKLNVHTGHFEHFFEEDGLPNNVTYEIRDDGYGNLWISTNSGLGKLNTKTRTFRTFTTEDGLPDNEFNSKAVLKSSTGELYFGGVKGFAVFDPKNIRENVVPPSLQIQSYDIFDTAHPAANDRVFSHNENYLTFHYAALEFSSPEKIRFMYTLEGIDKDWHLAGAEREAHYTNLDPGRYTFRVKAANADGYWTEPGSSMTFVIRPPFWKTWWFSSLAIVMALAAIYGVHRYRLEQSLKVERLRNKIASDLHDEVGSSLTRISIYSDLVQNGAEEEENKSYLKGISTLSREVVLTMSDIVWSIDNRYDTMEALILRMKDFATEVLQAKNIALDFQVAKVDLSRILDPALKQNLYLIFKEAVNNIVKHAQAKHVNVLLTMEKGEFRMHIRDDGKGLPAPHSAKGNGLRNMRRRAEAINGQLEIRNANGTELVLTRKGR